MFNVHCQWIRIYEWTFDKILFVKNFLSKTPMWQKKNIVTIQVEQHLSIYISLQFYILFSSFIQLSNQMVANRFN